MGIPCCLLSLLSFGRRDVTDLVLENLALRQQLAVLQRSVKRPRLRRREYLAGRLGGCRWGEEEIESLASPGDLPGWLATRWPWRSGAGADTGRWCVGLWAVTAASAVLLGGTRHTSSVPPSGCQQGRSQNRLATRRRRIYSGRGAVTGCCGQGRERTRGVGGASVAEGVSCPVRQTRRTP